MKAVTAATQGPVSALPLHSGVHPEREMERFQAEVKSDAGTYRTAHGLGDASVHGLAYVVRNAIAASGKDGKKDKGKTKPQVHIRCTSCRPVVALGHDARHSGVTGGGG